jgi:hypothetical protein
MVQAAVARNFRRVSIGSLDFFVDSGSQEYHIQEIQQGAGVMLADVGIGVRIWAGMSLNGHRDQFNRCK